MKCFPSGRNHGQRWVVCLVWSITVAGEVLPSCTFTFSRKLRKSGENTIVLSAPQLPPRELIASATTVICPPVAEMVLSFLLAKNPMLRPSGDQKGCAAFSVPSSGCAESLESTRTHNIWLLFAEPATK